MIFIEAPIFTNLLNCYLSDDDYKDLQHFLLNQPNAGSVIQGTGGLRKLRWSSGNKGKRGGIRVIYYFQMSEDQIYFLTLYAKNEAKDLTTEEKKLLKYMIERWNHDC